MRLAPSLHRLGEEIVCCYLVEEAGAVTLIDAGVPAYYADLTAELAAMGRTIEDVRALVLTHGHDDHIGFAERLRAEHDVPVSIHELDLALARGEAKNPAAGMGERRLRSLLHYMLWGIRHGAMRTKVLTDGRHASTRARRWTCRAHCASSTHPDTRMAASPFTRRGTTPSSWETHWRRTR